MGITESHADTTALDAVESSLKGIEFDEFFESVTSFDPIDFALRRC